MFTVYVPRSTSTGRLYIGQTADLQKRLREHNEGIARYTRNRGPWRIVHSEKFASRSAAMARERQLKSGKGREWLSAVVEQKTAGS